MVESQKALARGLREELDSAFPELKGINSKEGELIELEPVLERAVRRMKNKDVVGFGTTVAAGAGGAAAGPGGAVAGGLLRAVLDDPTLKSRIAIGLHRATTGSSKPLSVAAGLAKVNAYVKAAGESSSLQPSMAGEHQPGDTVELSNGDTVMIKKINGDGTFEY
jgi:hypothetical protein